MSEQKRSTSYAQRCAFIAATLISLIPFKIAHAIEDKMLVLDVSGSMWGQLEGKTKIDIARDVLKDVIKEWPVDTNAGLIAYGHREKGNCSDIEVVLPMNPLDTDVFGKTVDALTPRGKTPLSDAVRLGADELKFTEQKATVVLISDGKETCDQDPCALGLTLERLGIDFTTHVIGFDVTAIEDQQGLRCLATNTGGDYFTATTDKELEEALKKVTSTERAKEYPTVALHAPIEVKKGTDFSVDIIAKEGLDGRVKLFAPNTPKAVAYQRIQKSPELGYKPVPLRAPDNAGEYMLKFITPDDKQELTSRVIHVVDTDIELVADSQAFISSTIDISLIAAPSHMGRIALYKKGDAKPYAHQAISTDNSGNYKNVALNTPSVAGEYIIRLENTDNEVLAEKPLGIEPADIALDVVPSAPMATIVTTTLLAPEGLQGRLQLHPAEQRIALDSQRIGHTKNDGYKPVEFQLPAIAGEYEIRFVSLSNDILAKTTVTAIEQKIGLTLPATANTREIVVITPYGPDGLDGTIQLETESHERVGQTQRIKKAKGDDYEALKFKIPDKAGAYFLRFYTRRNELVLQEQITVTD